MFDSFMKFVALVIAAILVSVFVVGCSSIGGSLLMGGILIYGAYLVFRAYAE